MIFKRPEFVQEIEDREVGQEEKDSLKADALTEYASTPGFAVLVSYIQDLQSAYYDELIKSKYDSDRVVGKLAALEELRDRVHRNVQSALDRRWLEAAAEVHEPVTVRSEFSGDSFVINQEDDDDA